MSKRTRSPKGSSAGADVPPAKPFFRPFEELKKAQKALKSHTQPAAAQGSSAKGATFLKAPAPPSVVLTKSSKGVEVTEEPASFAELLYGVEPLAKDGKSRVSQRVELPATQDPAKATRPGSFDADEAVRAHLRALVEKGSDARFEVSDDGWRIEGKRVEVDMRLVRKLRRGEFAIDARYDLHGLSAHEAREAAESFVRQQQARGERVLLIVHGKGEHSPRGQGVLRGEIAAWLSQGTASPCVDAFTTALPDDGGQGALYVLLRRPQGR